MVLRLTTPGAAENSAEPQGAPAGNGSQPQGSGGIAQDSQAPKQGDFSGVRDRRADPKLVGADLALDLVLKEMIQQARLSTMATGAFIGLAKGHKLVGPATSGSNAGDFVAYLNKDRRVVDACFRAGQVVYCRDAETSEEFEGSTCRYLGAKSVILIPILGKNEKKLGIFGVFSPHVDAFSGTSLVALQSMSQRIVDVIVQIERSTSDSSAVSAGNGSLSLSNADQPSPDRGNSLRSGLSRLAAVGPALWGFGILAILLLVGWTVSRALGPRTHPANVLPAAAAAAAQPDSSSSATSTAPVSAQSATEPPSDKSGNATANTSQTPAQDAAVKSGVKPAHPAATPAAAAKPNASVVSVVTDSRKPTAGKTSKPVRNVASGSQAGVPDLEIENALDDGSFEPPPPARGSTSKGPNQPGTSATPRPAPRSNGAPANSVTSAPASTPALAASSSPSLVSAPPREAIRIAKDPEPGPVASPSSNGADAGNDPSVQPPVELKEWGALARVAHRVEPDYPPDAKAQHTQGTVVLSVVVGTDGRVQEVTAVDGDHPFREAAIKALNQWRFAPFLRNGQAVRFQSEITFKFVLP